MHIANNTILITGGATGIGFALAEQFLSENNTVIICGRREEALQAAKQKLPELHIRVADLNNADERRSLIAWTLNKFPNLNILVNNAGIQREFRVKSPSLAADFLSENEIETNLTAPIHLTFLVLPHLLKQKEAAVVNIHPDLDLYRLRLCPFIARRKPRCNLSARRCVIRSEKPALRFLMSPRRSLKPICTEPRQQNAINNSKGFRPNELVKKRCKVSEKTIMKSPSDWLVFHERHREYSRILCSK